MGIYVGENPLSVPGMSAYQEAIKGGFAGTREDFDKALKDLPDHLADEVCHITAEERTFWNGKAPGGFGLGESRAHETITDCNDVKRSGLYIMSTHTINYPSLIPNAAYSLLRVSARIENEILQETFTVGISGQLVFSATRSSDATGWQPWEYINPPMKLDIEYRTTERYLGKPVYVKVVDCGACPASSWKDVTFGEEGVVVPVRCYGNFGYGGGSTIPFQSTETDAMQIGALINFIRIHTNGKNFSSYNCTATVYYIKTTD